jgi:hypothetical protein
MKMNMHLRLLPEKLLMIVLLLVGLSFLQVAIVYTLPLILPTDNLDIFIALTSNSPWISNVIFGIVILWLMRGKGLVAIPIALLSIVLPPYGTIFYILTTLQNKLGNDQQEFKIDK